MMVGRQAEKVGLQDSLKEIEAMIGQTMQELRRLTRALRPIYLEDLGLVTALETLTLETSATSKIQMDFVFTGKERRLPDNVEIALFRISQEALSNIMRHSEATNAQVSIRFTEIEVELTISDNGKGFSPPTNPAELSNIGHFGLLGIHERTELIGGKFTIQSNSEQGSHLILQIPS
jgi:signal transduction histidine kinase